jgi:hypothetical protein
MKSKYLLIIFIIILSLTAGSCAKHNFSEESPDNGRPGFFHGLLHGFIILFSFIGSFFTDYEIYAFPNSGGWYDFGFLLGVSIFFGGSGAGSARRYRDKW